MLRNNKSMIPKIKFTKFFAKHKGSKENKKSSEYDDNEIETLIHEIYNIDSIVDFIYKTKLIEKAKSIIRKEIINNLLFQNLEYDLLDERKRVINRLRKDGKRIIYIENYDDILELFRKQNKVHYCLYKYTKNGKNMLDVFELINFVLNGFDINRDPNQIIYYNTMAKRKSVVIDFLKQIHDSKYSNMRVL